MPQVSREHKEDQKAKIVEAALKCFRSNGIAETTMRHIFSECGMSAGAVYNYFPSKIELIEHLAQETRTRWRQAFIQLQETEGAPKEKLTGLIDTMIDGLSDPTVVDDVASDLGIWIYSIHHETLRKACKDVFEDVAKGFDQILAGKSVGEASPLIGTYLLAHLQGLGLQVAMGAAINPTLEKKLVKQVINHLVEEIGT